MAAQNYVFTWTFADPALLQQYDCDRCGVKPVLGGPALPFAVFGVGNESISLFCPPCLRTVLAEFEAYLARGVPR